MMFSRLLLITFIVSVLLTTYITVSGTTLVNNGIYLDAWYIRYINNKVCVNNKGLKGVRVFKNGTALVKCNDGVKYMIKEKRQNKDDTLKKPNYNPGIEYTV